jgi:hypothetical protein
MLDHLAELRAQGGECPPTHARALHLSLQQQQRKCPQKCDARKLRLALPACFYAPTLAVIDYHCRWLDRLLSQVMHIVQVPSCTSWCPGVLHWCFSRARFASCGVGRSLIAQNVCANVRASTTGRLTLDLQKDKPLQMEMPAAKLAECSRQSFVMFLAFTRETHLSWKHAFRANHNFALAQK